MYTWNIYLGFCCFTACYSVLVSPMKWFEWFWKGIKFQILFKDLILSLLAIITQDFCEYSLQGHGSFF